MSGKYLHQLEGILGLGETYFSNNFYETHLLLHFKPEMRKRIQVRYNRHAHWLYLFIIISHQCCVLVILVQEILSKEKGY